LAVNHHNRTNPSIVVEILADTAELRMGEIRWPVVVYRRLDTGKVYVRPKAEFEAKFVSE
jgi:hypothetical protein